VGPVFAAGGGRNTHIPAATAGWPDQRVTRVELDSLEPDEAVTPQPPDVAAERFDEQSQRRRQRDGHQRPG